MMSSKRRCLTPFCGGKEFQRISRAASKKDPLPNDGYCCGLFSWQKKWTQVNFRKRLRCQAITFGVLFQHTNN